MSIVYPIYISFIERLHPLTSHTAQALHWSCLRGSLPHAEALLALGMDVMSRDSEGKTPVHWAATTTNVALINRLMWAYHEHPFGVAARADPSKRLCHAVNVGDHYKRTPLHVAIGIGNTAIASVMLRMDEVKLSMKVGRMTHMARGHNMQTRTIDAHKILL